jgi:AraC family transcriptional regulator
MTFEVAIVEYPAKRVAGLKIETNMQNAMQDCPKAWEAFMPRMTEVDKEAKEAFGVSVIIDENEFGYWAALEIGQNQAIPDGMSAVEISAGTYACCTVPSMEKLGDAYMYLFDAWIKGQGQGGYTYNMKANTFERYCDWDPSKPFEIYMPVMKA